MRSGSQPSVSDNSESPGRKVRDSTLKRRVLAGLEVGNKAKKPRVLYSDDSDNEDEPKPVKSSTTNMKKTRKIDYSDSESDVEMLEAKKPVKPKKLRLRSRKRKNSSSDSDKLLSDESDANDRASVGMFSNSILQKKKNETISQSCDCLAFSDWKNLIKIYFEF